MACPTILDMPPAAKGGHGKTPLLIVVLSLG